MSLNAAGLAPTNAFRVREPLVATIDHPASNRDRGVSDTLEVELRNGSGDAERLTMMETGPDTGRFAGAIPTRGGAVVTGDCRLTVRAGATSALSFHLPDGATLATASVSYLIDPFGIVFDSAMGERVSGVRVSLVNAATWRPAPVFGDDGVSAYPSTVITGQSVTDASGTRDDLPPGDYRFPLAPPGRSRIVVEPPAPYTAPSTVPRDALTEFLRPNEDPHALMDASNGEAFVPADSAPLRVDIPNDAPAGSLLLAKVASVAVAEPGDVVQYRVTIRNADASRATGPVSLTDAFPRGFRLHAGSVRYKGAPVGVTSGEGRGFVAALPSIAQRRTAQRTRAARGAPDRGSSKAAADRLSGRTSLRVRPPPAQGASRRRSRVRGSRATRRRRARTSRCPQARRRSPSSCSPAPITTRARARRESRSSMRPGRP